MVAPTASSNLRRHEPILELVHDSGGKHVGHLENRIVHVVVRGHVVDVPALEVSDRLGKGEVEVLPHHRLHVVHRPLLRVRRRQERRDLVGVGVPRGVGLLERRVVSDLRGRVAGLAAVRM